MSDGAEQTLAIGRTDTITVRVINDTEKFNMAGLLLIKIFIFVWVFGVVIAEGFWSTFFAIIFPPYDLYLFIEYCLKVFQLPLH